LIPIFKVKKESHPKTGGQAHKIAIPILSRSMSGYALDPIQEYGVKTSSNFPSFRRSLKVVDLERIVALSFYKQLSVSPAPVSPQIFERQSDDYLGI